MPILQVKLLRLTNVGLCLGHGLAYVWNQQPLLVGFNLNLNLNLIWINKFKLIN